MALTLTSHPEFSGLAAFLSECNFSDETLNKETNFHHVQVCGVQLRITGDMEYVVAQDLFVKKSKATKVEKAAMTGEAYRIRSAYTASRTESQVGFKRLAAYRALRGDPNAPLFFAKSRAQGGKTPPPVMGISIIRYYIHSITAESLGLDKFPEFLSLISEIELLPDCPLEESLRGKHMRHLMVASDNVKDEPKATPSPSPIPVAAKAEDDVTELRKMLNEAREQLSRYKKPKKNLEQEVQQILTEFRQFGVTALQEFAHLKNEISNLKPREQEVC
jgi:hypothetical protein